MLADDRITTMGLLAEVFHGVSHRLDGQLAEHGLKPLEFEVLLRLGRSAGGLLRMTDLAAQAHITTSGVTRVVDRLESDGLVARQACKEDRRVAYAALTDAGHARLGEVLPGHVELLERWLTGPLTADQTTALVDALRTVRDGICPTADS